MICRASLPEANKGEANKGKAQVSSTILFKGIINLEILTKIKITNKETIPDSNKVILTQTSIPIWDQKDSNKEWVAMIQFRNNSVVTSIWVWTANLDKNVETNIPSCFLKKDHSKEYTL